MKGVAVSSGFPWKLFPFTRKRFYKWSSLSCKLLGKYILPLFIRRKLGTSKINCGVKILKKHVCLHFQIGNSVPIKGFLTASSYLFGTFINFDTFSKLKTQVINSNTTDSPRIQRDSRKIGLLAIQNTSKRQLG